MAKKERINPLDTDAAKPLESGFVEAAAQVKADDDQMRAEVMARVSSLSQEVSSLSSAIISVVGLVEKIVPLVTRVNPLEGPGYVADIQDKLLKLRQLACSLTGKCNG